MPSPIITLLPTTTNNVMLGEVHFIILRALLTPNFTIYSFSSPLSFLIAHPFEIFQNYLFLH